MTSVPKLSSLPVAQGVASTKQHDLAFLQARIAILEDPKGDLNKLPVIERDEASNSNGRAQLLEELRERLTRMQDSPNW